MCAIIRNSIVLLMIFPASLIAREQYVFPFFQKALLEKIAPEFEEEQFATVWGQTIENMAEDVSRLNLHALIRAEGEDGEKFRAGLDARIKKIRLQTPGALLRKDIDAVLDSRYDGKQNTVILYGGTVVVANIVAAIHAHDRLNVQLHYPGPMLYDHYNANLTYLLRKRWRLEAKEEDPGYQLLKFLSNNSELSKDSERKKREGRIQHSFMDYYLTDFSSILLFVYAHELNHLVLGHAHPEEVQIPDQMSQELQADQGAVSLLFSRIKGKWGIRDSEGKAAPASFQPLVHFLSILRDVEPEDKKRRMHFQTRIDNILRWYIFLETHYGDIPAGRKKNALR